MYFTILHYNIPKLTTIFKILKMSSDLNKVFTRKHLIKTISISIQIHPYPLIKHLSSLESNIYIVAHIKYTVARLMYIAHTYTYVYNNII